MATEVMTAPEGRIIHKTYAVLSGAAIPQRVHVTQYDESLPVIACTLYKDGQLYTIPDGASVRLRMNKNGLPVYHEAMGINDARHVVYLEITAQMTVLYGEFAMVIEVETSDGKTAGTSYLRLIVRQNPVQNPELDNIPDYTANSNRLTAEGVKKLQDESSTQQKAIEDKGKNTLESIPADYGTLSGKVNENTSGISYLKEDLTKISEQKAYMDGVTNLFNWIRGSYTVSSNKLAFNADNKYAIATPIAVSVINASYIKISDFETYKYTIAITYGTDNWYYLKATSNPFEIPKNVTGLVVSVGRRDNAIITDYDITSVRCIIISDNEFDHLVALTELFSMPKTIKNVIENTQTNTSADAFLLNENISMDTNNAKGLFSKKIGGIGSITFTDWLPSKQLSNTFNVQQDDDYIYKCMHFPHDGTYPNLQYQDPNIIDVESLPFKLPIGAIYVNTDVAEEFNGLIRIIACNMFGYKKGYWYEIDNRNIKWAQIYSLPWGTSDGTNIPIVYQDGTALINLTNNKLTKNNVLHFGTANTYATEFDYYIVKVTVRCNKDSCGLKVGIDSHDNISGSPTQIVESRTFALNANTTLTAFAHNIPDSVYNMVITNFDNYVRLKVSHYYCGRVQTNGFIINLLKNKKSVTTIKDLDSGEETKIIIDDGSVDTSSNNLIAVAERYSYIEVTAKKDIFLNIIVSDTDAIGNYNFDLIN